MDLANKDALQVLEVMTTTLLAIAERNLVVSQEQERTDTVLNARITAVLQANQQLFSENQQLKTENKRTQERYTQLEEGSKAKELADKTLVQKLQEENAQLQKELEKKTSELSVKKQKLDVFEKAEAKKEAEERFAREHPDEAAIASMEGW